MNRDLLKQFEGDRQAVWRQVVISPNKRMFAAFLKAVLADVFFVEAEIQVSEWYGFPPTRE